MDEFVMWLGHERRLLERLLFKLVEGRELLAAGEVRFLGFAAAEVERAASGVEEAELVRCLQLSRLAGEWQVPVEQLTLGALSWVSPEPHRTLFEDHHTAFLGLMAEIDEVAGQNRRLAARGVRTHDGDHLSPEAGAVDDTALEPPMAEAGYQAILSAATGVGLPSLADFLAAQEGPREAASTPSTTRVSSAGRKGLAR